VVMRAKTRSASDMWLQTKRFWSGGGGRGASVKVDCPSSRGDLMVAAVKSSLRDEYKARSRPFGSLPQSVWLRCFSYQAEMQEWLARSNSHSARRRGWLFRLTAACRFRPRAIAPTQPATERPQLPDRRCRSSRNRLHGHLGPASVVSTISTAIPPAVRLGCADPQRMTLYAASSEDSAAGGAGPSPRRAYSLAAGRLLRGYGRGRGAAPGRARLGTAGDTRGLRRDAQ
jgi:hypothetical protein